MNLELSENEKIILRNDKVLHGGNFSLYIDTLILTNLNIVYIHKGILGNVKKIIKMPLNNIKIVDGKVEVIKGKNLTNDVPQLKINFKDNQESFEFASNRDKEIEKWINEIQKLVNTLNKSSKKNNKKSNENTDDKKQIIKVDNSENLIIFISAIIIVHICLLIMTNKIIPIIIDLIQVILLFLLYYNKKHKYNFSKKWIEKLIIIIVSISIIPSIYFSNNNVKLYDKSERYNWDEIIMAEYIPQPKSKYGKVISNSNKLLDMSIYEISNSKFIKYSKECKEKGFFKDVKESDTIFRGYNKQGYLIKLNYDKYNSKMNIRLEEPMKLSEIKWSESLKAKLIPLPNSKIGTIKADTEQEYVVYIGNMPFKKYNEYINECKEKGFVNEVIQEENKYTAKNKELYKIEIEYIGNDIICIKVYDKELVLNIELNSNYNFLFSTYDLKYKIDNNIVGEMKNGENKLVKAILKKGEYKLRVENKEDSNIFGEIIFNVDKNEDIKFNIYSHASEININKVKKEIPKPVQPSNPINNSVKNEENKIEPIKPKEENLEDKLESTFSRLKAQKALMVSLRNQISTDVFKEDRMTYDSSKFHNFSDIKGEQLRIEERGNWKAIDDKTWHIEGIVFKIVSYGTYMKVNADISTDGDNYIINNLEKTVSTNRNNFDYRNKESIVYNNNSSIYLKVPSGMIK